MANLIAKFTPPNSSKRYTFTLSPQADLRTVIKQFQLDLPSKYQLNDLHLRLLNDIDPKSDPKINAVEFFKALILLQDQHPLQDDEFDRLYVATKQLTTNRIRNAFKNASGTPSEVNYESYWFYIFDKPVAKAKAKKTANAPAADDTEPELTEITDFATLQSRALKLEHEYQDLQSGAASYKQVMNHADETNIMLTKQLEKLDHEKQKQDALNQKQHEFLKKNFGNYLNTDSQKMMFVESLIQNINQPVVQRLTHGKMDKFWNLVKAVCDYD